MAANQYPGYIEFELGGKEINVERISDGLGFGDGAISRVAIESALSDRGLDLAAQMHNSITNSSILHPISTDAEGNPVRDDGCGDGREAIDNRSEHRPKVFGGGLAMVVAGQTAMGHEMYRGLSRTFHDAATLLTRRGLDYGGHTAGDFGEHAEATGCGCLDRFVDSAFSTNENRASIGPVAADLASLSKWLDAEPIDDIDKNFMFYSFGRVARDENFAYDSVSVVLEMMRTGKVVKQLIGDHRETDILLNFVPGATANQRFVREQSAGEGQIFAVDMWRIDEIAKGVYPRPKAQQLARMGMIAFTLGVSGVLTKGDQRVWTATEAH